MQVAATSSTDTILSDELSTRQWTRDGQSSISLLWIPMASILDLANPGNATRSEVLLILLYSQSQHSDSKIFMTSKWTSDLESYDSIPYFSNFMSCPSYASCIFWITSNYSDYSRLQQWQLLESPFQSFSLQLLLSMAVHGSVYDTKPSIAPWIYDNLFFSTWICGGTEVNTCFNMHSSLPSGYSNTSLLGMLPSRPKNCSPITKIFQSTKWAQAVIIAGKLFSLTPVSEMCSIWSILLPENPETLCFFWQTVCLKFYLPLFCLYCTSHVRLLCDLQNKNWSSYRSMKITSTFTCIVTLRSFRDWSMR